MVARWRADFSPRYMHHKLIAGVNSASPANTICVETNLISLGRIYPLQTDFS
jgi:hypothetical protein